MAPQPIDFKDSSEAALRRLYRSAVRKSKTLTRCQRDVTLAWLNHWLHHKNKRQPIHPGKNKIMKAAQVSRRTMMETTRLLEAGGVLRPVRHERGGRGKATEYAFNVHALMVLCGATWFEEYTRAAGQFAPFNHGNLPPLRADKGGSNCPPYIERCDRGHSQGDDSDAGEVF